VGAGSLVLHFASPPQSLALAVGSGSGKVALPHGSSYRITRHGAGVHVATGLAAPGSGRLLTARVGAGILTLAYPAGTTPTLPRRAPSAPPSAAAGSG